MKKPTFLAILFSLLLANSVFASDNTVRNTIPVDQIKIGMRGVAYTVFEGVKPEAMDVEVLGVLRNAAGPKSDIILVRLHGEKVQYTGVVAGMSGSPVYIEGKLAGALAFRIGEFSKEPIAGVTPIAEMLEINALDTSQPAETAQSGTKGTPFLRTASPGLPEGAPLGTVANFLQPIDTPLVFNGFSEATLQRFATQFAAVGVTPVMGAGSVSGSKQPEPLEPGSSVSAVLVRGDMDIAATCTVTYMTATHLLACGHPLNQFGAVDMPMYKAQVLATLPSAQNSFKIVNTTEPVGAFVQDRHAGILGLFGKQPQMIPVTLTVRGGATPKQFHVEVLNNSKITPVAMMATVFNALQGVNESGEDATYRLRGRIAVNGFQAVELQNMYAPIDAANPTTMSVALAVGDRFRSIYENSYARPDIQGVELELDMVRERRWARLETARTDVTEARPGDDIVVEAVLRPYRGERMVRQIPVRIPTSTPKGNLRILISDGDTLDRMRRIPSTLGRGMDLASTIALLNKEHNNSRLYVSLLEANPEAMVEDKVMPGLPPSVMNVMDGMRGTQDMVVLAESAVNESSTPLDYVVAGSKVINVMVK